MQLNGFTFVLELVNFVVLVWVLARVLYRPVRAALERRQAETRATLAQAEAARREAAALEASHAERLAAWTRELEARRAELAQALDAERARRLARVDDELRAEREAETLARAQRAAEERARVEAEAITLAAAFAARLLAGVAGPELHRRLVERFVASLPALPAATLERARTDGATVEVRSAYPLEPAEREQLSRAFAELLHAPVRVEVRDAPELIAGVEVHVGAAALEANLGRELRFFADAARA